MSKIDKSADGLRYKLRAKRRKTNFILNGLIGMVLVLILLVSISIFTNDEDQKEATKDQLTEEKDLSNGKTEEKDVLSEDDNEEGQEDLSEESEPVITDGAEENVKKTIVDPNWQPIGTTQTGEHVAVYDSTSVDWKEMLDALAYATDLRIEDYTLWRLDNNGPNQSVGTISTKDKQTTFRVYIKWVDNEGWVPTRVEELFVNDKAQ